MSYDGQERRRSNTYMEDRLRAIELQVTRLGSLVESGLGEGGTLHSNNQDIKDILKKHDGIIYGNGKPGLNTFGETLKAHVAQDRWMFGIVITLQSGIFLKLFLG